MLCPNCGSENRDNSKFCKKCGSVLNNKNANNNLNRVEESASNAKDTSKSSNNVLIISITIIICLLIVASTFVYFNLSNNPSDSSSIIEDSSSGVDTSSVSSSGADSGSVSSSSTIDSDGFSFNVQGANFIVPSTGYMRTSDAFRFTYAGSNCEIERVPEFEASTSNWDLSSIKLSQDYQGGEPYRLIVNGHSWIGLKVQKDGNWYHISMNTDDVGQAESLLSWMDEHNTWNAP